MLLTWVRQPARAPPTKSMASSLALSTTSRGKSSYVVCKRNLVSVSVTPIFTLLFHVPDCASWARCSCRRALPGHLFDVVNDFFQLGAVPEDFPYAECLELRDVLGRDESAGQQNDV